MDTFSVRTGSPPPSSIASTPPPHRSKSTDVRHTKKADKETNIQVVVRCRKSNERDIVVYTSPQRCKEIVVHTNSTDKVSSKTYTFDRVFGQDTDQEQVYNDIVQPILEEVLMGYNCTIFAYGQTGTGKTYTMEGDLDTSPTPAPTPNAHRRPPLIFNPHAGIIPRTLHRLFDILESETAEFSVRVSSLELYNEELKDLLSTDEQGKLRIFDDTRGKGVVIDGLEKVLVNNAHHAIKVLRTGSQKRKVAATRSNEKSSRSHYVFTLTVHIKEATPDGEELLKVGKLNLVDLAGSENIGRSGAENERAREAKMINQSLLTLGRVINALTKRSEHVPYRESKLTRLLQDSLGGRTKTCIIATISPAKANLEETLSTLDYANRAKNILNKPEVNQRMTKKALIKEYIAEIERLKNDLNATRDKNGIYLTTESYQLMMEEGQSRKDQVEEFQRRATMIEERFETNMKLLNTTKEELEAKSIELREISEHLENARQAIDTMRQAWREETVLRKAHEYTEQKLDKMASGLMTTLGESVKDVKNLFGKLDRKSAIELENRRAFAEFQRGLLARAGEFEAQIVEFSSKMSGTNERICDKMAELGKAKAQDLSEAHSFIDERLRQISEDQATVQSAAKESGMAQRAFADTISAIRDELRTEMQKRHETSHKATEELFEALKKDLENQQGQLELVHRKLGTTLENILADTHTHVERSIRSLREKTSSVVEAETLRLQTQNSLFENLKQMVVQAQASLGASADDILLLLLCPNIEDSLTRYLPLSQFDKDHGAASKIIVDTNLERGLTKGRELVNEIERASQMAGAQVQNLATKSESTKKRIFDEMDGQQELVILSTQKLDEAMAAALQRQTIAEDQLESASGSLAGNTRMTLDRLGLLVDKVGLNIERNGQEVEGLVLDDRTAIESFYNAARHNVERTKAEINCYELEADEPTGKTPMKRDYGVPKHWNPTRDHKELLQEFREAGHVKQSFSTEDTGIVITPETFFPTPSLPPSPTKFFVSNGRDDSSPSTRRLPVAEPMSDLYDERVNPNVLETPRIQPPPQHAPPSQHAPPTQPQPSQLSRSRSRSRKGVKRQASSSTISTPASMPANSMLLSPSQSNLGAGGNAASGKDKDNSTLLPRVRSKRARGNDDENRMPA